MAPLYGRLLMLSERDDAAALRLLQRAIELNPDPDVAGLIALATYRLQQPEEARTQLQAALRDYCVTADGLLASVASELVSSADLGTPGWIGRDPHLQLVGELSAAESSTVLEIRVGGKPAFSQLVPKSGHDGARAFSIQSGKLARPARLEVSCRGTPLLGNAAQWPQEFALDGRAQCHGRQVRGWARIGWLPTRPVRLRLKDERGGLALTQTGRTALSAWRWPFEIDLRKLGLRGQRIEICALLPDGDWHRLPDTPLLLKPALRVADAPPHRLSKWHAPAAPARVGPAMLQNARGTDVIIPVYGGRDASLACINAVLATIDRQAGVIVVDDASDDPALSSALDKLSADGRITLLRNPSNEGFVASVNRALGVHPEHDAVLLNSDTLVFDDWLMRLRAAAYSGRKVGTVTPLSNSGTIASYPRALGADMDPEDAPGLHAFAAASHSGKRFEIPVGVGFCLYLRRDCLRAVGAPDAAVFGQGYGEETDFCLRARWRGWSHRLAADVFVYHAGAVSFGPRRAALLDRSQRLLNLRHPGYEGFIRSFLTQDPLRLMRRRLDERRLLAFDGRFVLLVTLALSGGVDRFVTERSRAMRAQGLYPLVLRAAASGNTSRCELWTDALELPNLRYEIPLELTALSDLLAQLPLEAIELQHFLHLDARVIETVRALPIPYDVFIHDYAWYCPRITLIDGSGRYCGEPAVEVCQSCVRRNGSALGESISVTALRERSSKWLRGARRVIAPSADTSQRVQRHFGVQCEIRPLASPATVPEAPPLRAPAPAGNVRVALIGALGEHKGYQVLLACARDARARRLPLEFVVIGYTEDDASLLATGRVFITGRYSEGEAAHLLRREQPHIAWLASVWPETWCYTLDYALSAGLPVVAYDLGAIAERLRAAGTGELLPLDMRPPRINDRLLQLVRGASQPVPRGVRSVQSRLAQPRESAKMIKAKIGEGKSAPDVAKQPQQQEGLSASVQVLPLPSGLYLFSVKAASPPPVRTNGQLSLPAIHVGLGPGVSAEQVEFIAGPSTHGAWLFAPGDLLVTRINGTGATLILSSLRAPSGEVLSIRVERLDNRSDVLAPAPAAAAPKAPQAPSLSPQAADRPLQVQIATHIRTRGDMNFVDVPWAGRVAPGLWIESFSVRPLERFTGQDIEYKGLTGSGFETPWLSDEQMCGTKGMAVPLVGFAVRFKPSAATAAYDCVYSGYFQSGLTIGPLRNGAPCRSSVANDSLEGIQVQLLKRASLSKSTAAPHRPGNGTTRATAKDATPGSVKPAAVKPGKAVRADRRQSTSVRSSRRPVTRRP
jgi:GT2 family glycosyltransferase/glycosyltransferase involved in cell wall biosynthesis